MKPATKRSTLFTLVSLVLFSLLLRSIPLFDFTYWGTDCGEYFYYAQKWIETGHIYTSIDGWGMAYPYFPGMFIFSGSSEFLTSFSLHTTIMFFPAVLSSLAPLMIFVLVHSITKKRKESLISALFLSILAPFVYNYSQPKPETVGFFLMILLLVLTIRLTEDNKKFLYLMIPSSFVLIVTHHLTSYFFALFLLGGFFVSIIIRRNILERDKLRIYFFIFFITALIIYWMIWAPPFRENRLFNALGLPSYSVIAVPYLFLIVILALKKIRDKFSFRLSIQYEKEDAGSVLMVSVPPVVFGISLLLYSSFINIPGSDITLGASALLYVPLIIFSIFLVPSRVPIRTFKEGIQVWGWILFTSLSFLAGAITGSSSLLPMRQVVFMMIPVSVLLGIGIAESFKIFNPLRNKIKTAAILSILLLLFAWNLPFMYPSQEMMDGYHEGSDLKDIEAGHWLKSTEGKIATDHRLSATIFSVSNKNITWADGKDIYFSDDHEDAYDEAVEMNITYIMWDPVMKKGVMTTAQNSAPPIDDDLISGYQNTYPALYDNGGNKVYFVNAS